MATSLTCDWCGEPITGSRYHGYDELECFTFRSTKWQFHHERGDEDSCLMRAIWGLQEFLDEDRERPQAGRERRQAEVSADQEERHARYLRNRAWGRLPVSVREHKLIEAIGDQSLSAAEIAAVLDEPEIEVCSSKVKPVLDVMVVREDLERAKQPRAPGSSSFKWLYSRSSKPLSPELASLEHALSDDEAVA